MPGYTNVSKPTGTGYTKLSPQGNEFFDDTTATFDSATVFFDGPSLSAWTKVDRPRNYENINVGMATGLLMPLTYSRNYRAGDSWIKVNKPT